MRLPDGFTVQVRRDVRRLEDGVVLVGGSPLRMLRLSARARGLIAGTQLQVSDEVSALLARRLLAGNLADPVGLMPARADDLTVVIPVRDRPVQLDRALAALTGLRCVVVDDASRDAGAIGVVARRHGATLIRLAANVGPAGARNAGLRAVGTPYVAFVDSDVVVETGALLALAGHLADPVVALVGPRVAGVTRFAWPRWYERYDAQASSLDLGPRPATVRPGSMIGWLPSACLVGRVEALADGFGADLRVAEDVDLVWRLLEAGHEVRYEPDVVAHHDVRRGIGAWLGRKVVYGSGGAELGIRHGDAIAPAALTPAMAVAGAALLARRRWSLPVAAVATAYNTFVLGRVLPAGEGRRRLLVELGGRSLGWAVVQESALMLRHWAPGWIALSLVSRRARRLAVSAILVELVVVRLQRGRIEPGSGDLARRLDDLAYGCGLWLGVVRGLPGDRRAIRALVPRLIVSRPGLGRARGRR